MPRRAPPTPLRLLQGPTPPRNYPRHTLPSIPRPTFHPPAFITSRFVPRHGLSVSIQPNATSSQSSNPILSESAGGATLSRPSSRSSLRGPWDHSGSIPVIFDVGSVLTPLKPVAASLGAGW